MRRQRGTKSFEALVLTLCLKGSHEPNGLYAASFYQFFSVHVQLLIHRHESKQPRSLLPILSPLWQPIIIWAFNGTAFLIGGRAPEFFCEMYT
jgi:hypothetical protein